MKEKKGIALISVILGIIILIVLVLITFEIIVITGDYKDRKEQTSLAQGEVDENPVSAGNSTGGEKDDDKGNNDTQKDNSEVKEGIYKWVGKYENEDGVTVSIYRDAVNSLCIDISSLNGNQMRGTSFDTYITEDMEEIVYEDEETEFEGGEVITYKENIKITYTDEGIELEASSDNDESFLNDINGNYVKQDYRFLGWNGVYVNGEITIVLAESYDDFVRINIDGGYLYANYTDKYTDKKITFNKESFGDQEKIIIEKTANGIKVEASTTIEDGILNGIDGEYIKEE